MLTLYGVPQQATGANPRAKTEIILSHTTLGMLGELTVAAKIQGYGFGAHQPAERQAGDLIATLSGHQLARIEVKTSVRGSRGTFQICLRRAGNGQYPKTDHRDSDLLVLLCVENDYSVVALVMPSKDIIVKKVEFRDPFGCKYSQYVMWQ
jgi:hypothetical protein